MRTKTITAVVNEHCLRRAGMGLEFSHKNSRKEHELLGSYKVNDGYQVFSCEAGQSSTQVHTRDQEEVNLCGGKNMYGSGRRRGRGSDPT